MKKIGEYTNRGVAANLTTIRIPLFDGRYDTGYKVTKFMVAPTQGGAANDVYAKLLTEDYTTNPRVWDWQDQREIAWSSSNSVTTGVKNQEFSLVDRENLIIEDVYFRGEDNGDDEISYYIEFDKYELEPFRGPLAMIENKSQG